MADKDDFGTDNNINEEEFVFHYKKGSFRDREDPLYRSIALGEKKVGKGLIGSLVSTKPNKIMFLTLVALTAFVFLWGLISGPVNSVKIDEVIFDLSAFSFDENVYLTLEIKNSEKSNKKDHIFVDLKFEYFDNEKILLNTKEESLLFQRKDVSYVRDVFPDHNIDSIKCTILHEDKTYEIFTDIKKR